MMKREDFWAATESMRRETEALVAPAFSTLGGAPPDRVRAVFGQYRFYTQAYASDLALSPPALGGPTFSGIAGTQGPTCWRGGGSSRYLPQLEGARGQGARHERRSGVSEPLR
jgi:hypothetical protein